MKPSTNLPVYPKLPSELAKTIDRELFKFLKDNYLEYCSKELDKQILGEDKMEPENQTQDANVYREGLESAKLPYLTTDDFREPTFEDKILQSLDKLHTRIGKLEIIVQDIEFRLKYG